MREQSAGHRPGTGAHDAAAAGAAAALSGRLRRLRRRYAPCGLNTAMRNLEELHFEIVVVGAGVGGIAAAIKLREAGITDFAVLDREDGVGGTWWTQTYPGLTIDIPSLTYSFSFEQKADWSSVWAPAEEMREYCRHCVDKYGVADHFRLGVTVTAARYDEQRNQWVLDTEDGRSIAARYLINASGFLSQPKWP